jgi:O-antigen ligase
MILIASVFSGARTFLLGFAGMMLAYVYVYRSRGLLSLLTVAVVVGGFLIAGIDLIRDPVSEIVETRITGRVERFGYEGLYGERTKIYFDNFPKAVERAPWVLLTGSGFQNISVYMGGVTGGHNNYLHVLMELGIVGLVIYLVFLTKVLKVLRRAMMTGRSRFEHFLAADAWVCFVGILATMLVGETLWAQYSTFTLSGQIMVYVGLAAAPAFRKIKTNNTGNFRQ